MRLRLALSFSMLSICALVATQIGAATTTVITDTTVGLTAWTVPAGIHTVTFDVYGAEGGYGISNGGICGNVTGGRLGGEATETLSVTPGVTYDLYVGARGGNGGCFGPGGVGGAGGNSDSNGGDGGASSGAPTAGGGGGGGGASDVRVGGTALVDRILVGAGGGGSGGANAVAGGDGGSGGGDPGSDGGAAGLSVGGFGATTAAVGAGGSSGVGHGSAGSGADGGAGGAGAGCVSPVCGGGGGGGAGYFGGGGGSADSTAGGGGGGGSSYGAAGTIFTHGADAANGGNGKIVITYSTTVSAPTPPANTIRAGYCSAPGDIWVGGAPITPGTFLNLDLGQPDKDSNYKGALPASFFQGVGITCGLPPGYTDTHTKVDGSAHTGNAGSIYEYWAKQ